MPSHGRGMRGTRPVLAALAVVVLIGSALAAPVAARPADQASTKVIVTFRDRPGPAAIDAVTAAGGEIRFQYRLIPAVAATMPAAAVAGLERNPLVKAVEPDAKITVQDHAPNTGIAELEAAWGVEHIGAGQVHAAGNTGAGVKVGVIDTGIDENHPDLVGRVVGGYDFINLDDDPMDDYGHGTHVAGSLAGNRGNGGVVGVAPSVELYSYKVLAANGEGDYSHLIAALERAVLEDDVDMVNMSLGGSEESVAMEAAVEAAYAQGLIMVAASGNVLTFYEYIFGCPVRVPAKYPEVFATTYTNENDALTGPSCTGPEVDFASPGDLIYSSVPSGTCPMCAASGYYTASGTSMASPHLAGTVALVLSEGITNSGQAWTLADDVKEHLCDNTSVGFGVLTTPIPQNDPRYAQYFGCGVTDANKALLTNPPPGGGGGDPGNSAPVANDDGATVAEDGSVLIDVLANDTDADSDPLTLESVTQPAHGTAAIEGSQVRYTPLANYSGADAFSYTVGDGTDTATADVSVTVTAVNDAPTANATSATTSAGTPVTIELSGTDLETCQLTFTFSDLPNNGGIGSPTNQSCTAGTPNTDRATVVYTPTAGFDGSDSFSYRVSDGTAISAAATVTVTVNAAPPPPPSQTMHVADLDGAASTQGGRWSAKVTIRVHTATHANLSGATVTGTWSTGGTATCTTKGGGQGGTCSVQSAKLATNVASTTFTVTGVTLSGWTYAPADNHDPDGESDSNGTFIVVTR